MSTIIVENKGTVFGCNKLEKCIFEGEFIISENFLKYLTYRFFDWLPNKNTNYYNVGNISTQCDIDKFYKLTIKTYVSDEKSNHLGEYFLWINNPKIENKEVFCKKLNVQRYIYD